MRFEISTSTTEEGKPGTTAGANTLQDLNNFVKRNLIQISYETLKDSQSKGFPKDPVMAVDGVVGRPIEQVRPFGKVEFNARAAAETIFLEMFEYLYNLQRVVTGTYRNSTFISVNGRPIASSPAELRSFLSQNQNVFPPGSNVRIYNTAPYAGVLERQGITSKSGGRVKEVKSRDKDNRRRTQRFANGLVRRANGAFYLASRAFSRKFGSQYFINFEFSNGPDLGIGPGTRPHGVGRGLRSSPRRTFHPNNKLYKGPYAYPSIRIYVRNV